MSTEHSLPGLSGWDAPNNTDPAPGSPTWQPKEARTALPGLSTWKLPGSSTPAPGSSSWRAPKSSNPAPGSASWTAKLDASMAASLKPKGAAIAAVAAITVAIVLVAAFSLGSVASLHADLMKGKWGRVEDNYILTLDFDNSSIEYDFHSSLYNDNIATLRYEVTGPNTIKYRSSGAGSWHTVEITIENNVMVCHPAITDSSSSEIWIRYEE